VVSWPELEARGAVAMFLGRLGAWRISIEAPDAMHAEVRAAIHARVPRLRVTSASLRVERGTCDGCGLPIGRPKLGWCPLCTAAWDVVQRERAAPLAARAA
jgi:RNA polymerase-binding transcription factor DksA